jgi:hypothetical protein
MKHLVNTALRLKFVYGNVKLNEIVYWFKEQ